MSEETGRAANGGGRLYPYKGVWPTVHETAFIAPGARIIGDVHIGAGSSIWFNCVLRGDVNEIRIGCNSNIQDGSVVHVEGGGAATHIGDNVLIGHLALVHGTTIEDGGFVGMKAVTMDGCHIGAEGMLGAGALLSPGKKIGPGELWIGQPARHVRDLSDEMKEGLKAGTTHYAELAQEYIQEL
ncbi:gamma carbonic anhydrase family protein [Emcibacter sp.]|uniref:gamma carbonic anhydrase family protein n=1 Tax=Emcibacter sp. TaxID=1979954 RepID=UPI002AA6BDB8|nr:gamma carbonic anhydrase family protein [Emcibacter sp.]